MEKEIKKSRKINKKKLAMAIIILLIIIATITGLILYCANTKFRNWTDKNILLKEIKQEDTKTIEFNGENSGNVCVFNKYIVTLENKILKIYNSMGIEEATITTDIINPVYDVSGNYLVVAEKNGESIYLLEDKRMLWSTKIEGKILDAQINENGYVGIVISDMSYKNIVSIYNSEGENLFKTYIATNKVVDISISRNNQYLAIAEVDLSGVLIQSSIKIIDMVKAKTAPNESVINIYSGEVGKLITKIEYQNKERLLCIYDDSIKIIQENEEKSLIKIENDNITFSAIELRNNIITVEETKSSEYGSSSIVNIINTATNKIKHYETSEIAKEIYTYENVIGLNFGTELHIINTNGWLMKKYLSNEEINQVVISNKIAAVIYRDRIEIINL